MSPLESYSFKDQFFEDDFSVNQCLSKLIQTANLETLKSHLKNIGVELHLQMAEILKTGTVAIVNLAEYSTNLHTKIDYLSISLSQIQEQLKVLHTLIKTAESECKKTLTQKNMNDAENNGLLARLDFTSITLYVDNIIRSIENYRVDEKLMCLERAFQQGITQPFQKRIYRFYRWKFIWWTIICDFYFYCLDSSQRGKRTTILNKGIYDDWSCTSNRVNHAMLIVGYTKEAWILKNWWGSHWGKNEYMKLRRHKNRCGIANYAAYALV